MAFTASLRIELFIKFNGLRSLCLVVSSAVVSFANIKSDHPLFTIIGPEYLIPLDTTKDVAAMISV